MIIADFIMSVFAVFLLAALLSSFIATTSFVIDAWRWLIIDVRDYIRAKRNLGKSPFKTLTAVDIVLSVLFLVVLCLVTAVVGYVIVLLLGYSLGLFSW